MPQPFCHYLLSLNHFLLRGMESSFSSLPLWADDVFSSLSFPLWENLSSLLDCRGHFPFTTCQWAVTGIKATNSDEGRDTKTTGGIWTEGDEKAPHPLQHHFALEGTVVI